MGNSSSRTPVRSTDAASLGTVSGTRTPGGGRDTLPPAATSSRHAGSSNRPPPHPVVKMSSSMSDNLGSSGPAGMSSSGLVGTFAGDHGSGRSLQSPSFEVSASGATPTSHKSNSISISTPGRRGISPGAALARQRRSSLAEGEGWRRALAALRALEAELHPAQGSSIMRNVCVLRDFLSSSTLRSAYEEQSTMKRMKNRFQELQASGRELQQYVGQFGLEEENKVRRRSVTLGNAFRLAVALGRLQRAASFNDLKDFEAVRASILEVSELSNEHLGKLREFESRMNDWDFDMFEYHRFTRGNSLIAIGLSTFMIHGLQEHLQVSERVLMAFFHAIQDGYPVINSYHNSIHAADVTHAMHVFLVSDLVDTFSVRPLEVFSMLIASAVHDYKHPGLNNKFMMATHNAVALTYNDQAVLENMHVAEMFRLIHNDPHLNVFRRMSKESQAAARRLIIASVLGTDMGAHFPHLSKFKSIIATVTSDSMDGGESKRSFLDLDNDGRQLVLTMALHVADVNNPMRPTGVYRQWAYRVMDEFFLQGDQESARGLDVSPFMDRATTNPVACQSGFIKFIVKPLYDAWADVVPTMKPKFDKCLAANLAWLDTSDCFADMPKTPVTGRYITENIGHVDGVAAAGYKDAEGQASGPMLTATSSTGAGAGAGAGAGTATPQTASLPGVAS